MRRLLAILMITMVAMVTPALASDISYTFIEGGYIDVNPEDGPEGSGFGVGVSGEFGDYLYLFAGYSDVDFDDILPGLQADLATFEGGAGLHFDFGQRLSIFGEAGLLNSSLDFSDGSEDDENGYVVAGGAKFKVKRFEFEGKVGRGDMEDSEPTTVYSGGVRFDLTKSVALAGSYAWDDDSNDTVTGGLRLTF
jgi:hypothetical protein